MNKKEKYIYEEIKRANKLSELAFMYLYKLDEKQFYKTLGRLGQINEILTQLEIIFEMEEEENEQLQ